MPIATRGEMVHGLDWARNRFVAGGARKVVLVAISKFVPGGPPTQVIDRLYPA
ncbi:MAG: hypothetical protein ACLP9L_03435 [Thermoguttaceae bacterium]